MRYLHLCQVRVQRIPSLVILQRFCLDAQNIITFLIGIDFRCLVVDKKIKNCVDVYDRLLL